MPAQRKVVILGTGGTIAGQGEEQGGAVGYQAAQLGVEQLIAPVWPVLLDAQWTVVCEQVAQLDSKDMDISTWQKLAATCIQWLEQPDVAGLVITHGTDTLEETAWFLHCVLGANKPVVLTCAMRPFTALSADGPANLRDALTLVQQGAADSGAGGDGSSAGVWVVAAGEVHSAKHVRKEHPYRLHAFSSGEYGPAGWVEEGQVRWAPSQAVGASVAAVSPVVWSVDASQWPWVEIITSTAGAHPVAVDALVAAGVQGLVVAATGNGSVHQAWLPALLAAQQQGVQVRYTTRCAQGHIVLAFDESNAQVCELSPVKARISLMLTLLSNLRRA